MKVYIANMPERTERLAHVLNEFNGKDIFDVEVVRPEEGCTPQVSLMLTFIRCVTKEKEKGSDYFVFCEDDHTFYDNYSEAELLRQIAVAQEAGVELLSGGVFSVYSPTRITENTYAIEGFGGTQFIVIFKSAYDKIIDANNSGVLDQWLCKVLDRKCVIFPFISYQYNSGTSITWGDPLDMKNLFDQCNMKLQNLNNLCESYRLLYDNH